MSALLTTVYAVVGTLGVGVVMKWLWTVLFRPALDSFVYAANVRRRPEHEKWLRDEVFKEDIAIRKQRDADIAEALRLAKEAAASAGITMEALTELNDKVDQIMPVCQSMEDVKDQMEELNTYTRGLGESLAHISGYLNIPWDGKTYRRQGDPKPVRGSPK